MAFLVAVAAVVGAFLYYSNRIVKDLAQQERQRMQTWADATKEIVSLGADEAFAGNIDFLLGIIESNTTIPVLLTDDDGNILQHRNFALPEAVDPADPLALSPANERYLKERLHALSHTTNVIHITISPGADQHLYYEDSKVLRRLSYYPYIQVLVMLAFVAVVYFAVLSTKKAEQNRVWVGLSKETAHQLGTPISSLMAWIELLPTMGVDADTVAEMDKDVQRLSTIASRFSKIGSVPKLETADLSQIVASAVGYMATRVSQRITLTADLSRRPLPVRASAPLLEWVLENLIKNAVDAMPTGAGSITVTTSADSAGQMAVIDVTDTGRGMARKAAKRVFDPGFTTKRRGWGLGLTLARRIVAQYHNGRIWVRQTAPGQGTTFSIEIPLTHSTTTT